MLYKNKLLERYTTVKQVQREIEQTKLSEKYPGLTPVIKLLQTKQQKIESLRMLHFYKNQSEVKKVFRRNLATCASNLSGAVYAYAQISGNIALKNAIQYSFSDFYRAIENTMLGRCRQVLNACKKIKDGNRFGIYPKHIQQLSDAIATYIDYMHTPTASVKGHARNYRQINKLLNNCFYIIDNQIAPIIKHISTKDSYIYRNFLKARKVDKTPGRKRKYIRKAKAAVQLNLPVVNSFVPTKIGATLKADVQPAQVLVKA